MVITYIDTLVLEDHLLRKIENVMDFDWLFERPDPYYNHEVGLPGTDPVVLIKMVLIQHLFGITSLRQTFERIKDTVTNHWFLGYSLQENILHIAMVSYAFCKRFLPKLGEEFQAPLLGHRGTGPALGPEGAVEAFLLRRCFGGMQLFRELLCQDVLLR